MTPAKIAECLHLLERASDNVVEGFALDDRTGAEILAALSEIKIVRDVLRDALEPKSEDGSLPGDPLTGDLQTGSPRR